MKEQFSEIFDTTHLTLEHEIAFDSSSYCSKSETRVGDTVWTGTDSYRMEKNGISLTLHRWQKEFVELIQNEEVQPALRDRKVMVVSNPNGGSGKSLLMKYLQTNEGKIGINVAKLPIDKPDRLRSAVVKIMKKRNVSTIKDDFVCKRDENH